MKMSPEILFLLKCLAVVDSVYIVSPFITDVIPTMGVMLGFGNIALTGYIYLYQVAYCLYVAATPLTRWTVCLLTIQR